MSVLDCLFDTPTKRWLEMHLGHEDREFCLIWPFSRASNGYGQIGDERHIPHRLMCEHRNGPAPSPEHQAAHSCGKGHYGCVNPWHLNWKTVAENNLERFDHSGLAARAKLTLVQVDEIREAKGREILAWTAQRFGVTESTIRQIQSGKTWSKNSKWSRPLSAEEVITIRASEKTAAKLALDFGVSAAAVYRVKSGNTYRWVPHSQPYNTRTPRERT